MAPNELARIRRALAKDSLRVRTVRSGQYAGYYAIVNEWNNTWEVSPDHPLDDDGLRRYAAG